MLKGRSGWYSLPFQVDMPETQAGEARVYDAFSLEGTSSNQHTHHNACRHWAGKIH